MNPQQSSPVPPQTGPTPQQQVHQRTRTPDEIKELGLVAVEEPQPAIPHADAAIPVSAFAQAPQAASPLATPLPVQPPPEPSQEAQEVQEVIVPLNQPIIAPAPPPPPPEPVAPSPQPVPDAAPTPHDSPEFQPGPTPESVVAPSAAPVLQPVAVPPTAMTAMAPSAMPSRAADVAVPAAPQQLELPAVREDQQGVLQVSSPQDMLSNNDRMDMSANSMQLRNVSRLHALSILLYLLIIALAVGVIVGGFYLRKYLVSGA